MKKTEEKKATPREDWLKARGITVGWAHVAGDPHKGEFVSFCMFLRKEKTKQHTTDAGQKIPLFEHEWQPMSYSMGPGLFREWKTELMKTLNFHDEARRAELTRKYLRPNVESFLASLIADVSPLAQGTDFASWVDDYGMNEDAKRAHTVWGAVQHAWAQLRELLGYEAYKFATLQIEDDHT